jgi:hypothetical protein
MNWLINLAGGFFGLKKLWNVIDNAKGYITGVVTILTGAAGLLQEYLNISGAHNLATLFKFAKTLPANENWLMILAGAGVIAASHKAAKMIVALKAPVTIAETPAPKLCDAVLPEGIPPAK